MTMQSGGVRVRIWGDDSDLRRTLGDSAKRIAKWSAVAASAAAVGGAALVKAGLDSADAQAKLSRQLGTTVEDLAKLRRAFDLAGVSQEQLRSGTRALTNRLAQAAQGTGPAADAFGELGLSIERITELPLSERVEVINAALFDNVAANERAAVAARIYGEEAGLALAQVSPEVLAQAADEVDRLGFALSQADAAAVERANDAVSQLGMAAVGARDQFAAQLSPAIEAVANEIGNQLVGATQNMEDGVDRAARATVEAFADVVDAAASVIEFVDNNEGLLGFGLMGRIILGKRGLLIGSVTGAIFDQIKDQSEDAYTGAQSLANAMRDVADAARQTTEQGIEVPDQRQAPDLNTEEIRDQAEEQREIYRQQAQEYVLFQRQRAEAAKETIDRINGYTEEERKAFSDMISQGSQALQAFAGLGAQLAQGRVAEERRASQDIIETMRERLDSSENMTDEEKKAVREAAKEKIQARREEAKDAFETQKSMQKAAVVVNTAAAIMMHLATDPNPFSKWAGVAAISATGATQWAAINQQQLGGGFSLPSASAPASAQGGGMGGGQQQAQQTEPTQIASFNIQGDVFGRDQVIGLIGQINDVVGDGVRLETS